MEANRTIALSIAGLDPSGGAGLLADIKTFEQHKVYGLGVCTAQTVQTENDFFSIRWEQEEDILVATGTLLSCYDVKAVKIGITENQYLLSRLISFIQRKKNNMKIILDTVIRSGSGFSFWNDRLNEPSLLQSLSGVYLITPNYQEALQLMPSAANAKDAAEQLSIHCNVLLKGGHNEAEKGVDYLYLKGRQEKLTPGRKKAVAKHGSGCVLSAAITANLARGHDIITACKNAKQYTEGFLASSPGLLGYHHV